MSSEGLIFRKLAITRGPDLVTVPVLFNQNASPQDTTPVVPANLVHEKVVGHELMPREDFMTCMEELSHRVTTEEEDR